MSIQFMLFLVLHLTCTAVPQTILTVTTDPICPNGPVEFTCTVHNVIALRWLVDDNVQVTYMSDGSSTNTPVEGIQTSLGTIQPDGTDYDFNSTLTVSDASVLVGREVICDGGGPTTAESQTLEFNSPPMPPEFNCNLPGQRTLRLEWINMNTDDSVDEYRACSCTGGGCPCVPTACGDLSNNCVRGFEADQVHNFMFTAVNCGNQQSTASTLTVDARADPPTIKVCALYNQSTGGLCNIAVRWDTVAPISVPVGCVEGVPQHYNVRCGDNFERLGLPQSTNCTGGMCQFESPASTECTLSVDSVNVMGTHTTDLDIPGTTPLTVTVSNEGRVTCNTTCIISYGTDPNFETLPNIITSDPAGVELMVSGDERFYVASADIGSRLTVKVKGSFRTSTETNIGSIVGGVVGGVGGVLVILILLLVYMYKHYPCQQAEAKELQSTRDGHRINTSSNGIVMDVNCQPPEFISYDPQQSQMFCVGIDPDQMVPKTLTPTDAKYLGSSLVDHNAILPKENLRVYVTPTNSDSCTKSKIQAIFKEQATMVGREGVFIFAFAGQGVKVGPQSWSLAGVDFNKDDPNTYITAVTLIQWILELPHKPKLILFILDCSSAGSIASEIASSENADGVCVLSSCGDAENPILLDTLGHSVFTYFMGWCFRTITGKHIIPLKEIYNEVTNCSKALSSLVITYDREQRELRHNTINPEAVHVTKLGSFKRMATDDGTVEVDVEKQGNLKRMATDDGTVERFQLITEHFDLMSKHTKLHERALSWLDTCTTHLVTLKTNGALNNKEVLRTVVCSLVFSLASYQAFYDEDSIEDPNTFILAFRRAAEAVSAVYAEADMQMEYIKYSWCSYMKVVNENNINDKDEKLQNFFSKVMQGN